MLFEVNDDTNTVSDRCDAMILFSWIGSLEAIIDELASVAPRESDFTLSAMKKYGQFRDELR